MQNSDPSSLRWSIRNRKTGEPLVTARHVSGRWVDVDHHLEVVARRKRSRQWQVGPALGLILAALLTGWVWHATARAAG